ncbi:ulp1 protease family, C-terminal catalytic domain-containing protein, partial [Tanacetum coccineum]
METLAPRMWIDANVIDCWVAILNHEKLVRGIPSPRRHFFQPVVSVTKKAFFSTGCITKAIIEGTINEEQQWKLFLDEFSAQFKHDVSSISNSEVDLAFFPICASGHFYVVVFHLKSPSTMIILDNSVYGETYNSKYKAVCEPL